MPPNPLSVYSRTPINLWLLSLLPVLLMNSSLTLAGTVPSGTTLPIDSNTPQDFWLLQPNSTLSGSGASTFGIGSSAGGLVELSNSTVTSSGEGGIPQGIVLTNATATLNNSTVTSVNGIGISAVRGISSIGGSTVNLSNNSVVKGLQGGIAGNRFSVLSLQNSTVEGTGANSFGIRLLEGSVQASGSTITGGLNGLTVGTDTNVTAIIPSTIVLNNSQVEGKTGAAIVVGINAPNFPTVANIEVRNGSSLISGNDTLVEVRTGGVVNLLVDNSHLTGNVVVAPDGSGNVTLQNNASLTGQVNNVTNFSIHNQAVWQMTDSQSVSNLTLSNGGKVRLGGDQEYFQLNVANLHGSGIFEMGTDFNKGVTDLLNVTANATGNHQLLVASSGADPVNDSSIKVVQTASGDAQFGLVNGPVDVGAFTYRLIKEGNDWYLQPDREVVSTSTRSVMAILGTGPNVIWGETALLTNRMGDLRVNGGQSGGWTRTFGSRYSISNNAFGEGYSQKQYGFSMGADTPVQIVGERVLLGVFAGYSKSDLDLSRGSSGEIDSTSVGLYGTWLGDRGYYLDTVAKLNHFRNDAKVMLSDGTKTKGNYNNLGASVSAEFGKQINFKDGYYVELFTQWQAASVQGKDFNLDNGLKADADTTRSMLGKVGATLGRGMTLSNGSVLQPHIRAAVVHEFAKNNEVRVNDNKFNNDLSGSRFEIGAGGSWTLNDRWQLHAELDTSKGDNVTKDFGINMGVHYAF